MTNYPTKKLGECLSRFDRGISWSRKNEGGAIAVLRIPNVEEGQINTSDLKYIDIETENGQLRKDDVVMVASNGNPDLVGRSALVTENETNMRFASFLVRLSFDTEKLLPHYAHLFLLTPFFKRELRRKIATTSGIYNLRKEHIEKIKIPLPPLEIQKQIVERLDKIVAAQKLNDELIQKTDELFQSFLHKELNPAGKNWEVKKLEEILEFIKNGTTADQNQEGRGYTVTRIETIQNNQIDPSRTRFVELEKEEFEKYKLRVGDILFSHINSEEHIGKVALFENQIKNLVLGMNLLVFRPREIVVPNYLYYYFLTPHARNQVARNAKRAVNQASINQTQLLRFKIPLPPLAAQKQIAAKLSAVQNYKTQLLAQKSKLKELFDSALSKSMKN